MVDEGDSYSLRLAIESSSTTSNDVEIIVKDKLTNEILYHRENITFTQNVSKTVSLMDLTSGNLSQRTYDLEFRINTQPNQKTFIAKTSGLTINKNATTAHIYSYSQFLTLPTLFIQDYLPKMKVLDFLTGLFKMFNLVAYTKKGSSQIYIQTFDDYMTLGVSRDITKYVDITFKAQ